jgi:hypothetical protein
MSLKATAELFVEAETRRIADKILWELRAACPKQSGRSARSFHVVKRGKNFAVVSDKLSAYYADQGNGGSGRLIFPRKAKALKITNGVNRTLGYARCVHGYDGAHFVKAVADNHR